MPELPEVETTARLLRPRLEGRRLRRVDVAWRRTLGGLAPRELANASPTVWVPGGHFEMILTPEAAAAIADVLDE